MFAALPDELSSKHLHCEAHSLLSAQLHCSCHNDSDTLIPSSAFSDTHVHMQTLTQTQIYTSIEKRKETAIINRKTKTVKPLQQNVRKSQSSSSESYWDRLVHIAIITREKKFVYISPLIYHCLFF